MLQNRELFCKIIPLFLKKIQNVDFYMKIKQKNEKKSNNIPLKEQKTNLKEVIMDKGKDSS